MNRHRSISCGIVFLMLWLGMTMASHGSTAGQLPLGYRIAAGNHPWTGRLHAISFRTASIHATAVLTKWEAGTLLDERSTASRKLYLGGERLAPLHWHAIDADARAVLHGPTPGDNGAARLAWLRGARSDTALRSRDTRLASGAGARVLVVPAPAWRPMQPGHGAFRLKFAGRPTTVWLGTRDGIVHGFDAVTGHELTGFLPRTMLPGASALAAPGSTIPAAPCPRPESIDADPSGIWRTLLLCGIPATDRQSAAVFVLDISAPDSEAPIGLLWETRASDALPLTGQGQVRPVMWIEHGTRRWAAIAIIAATREPGSRAGLALLPLDRPAARWRESGTVPRLHLPPSGCGTDTASARLLAASVRGDASGRARAAYAVDDRGRLWRFGLEHLGAARAAEPGRCLHRQRGGPDSEPPVVMHTSTGPLIIYASGDGLSAIPDRPGRRGTPAQIEAITSGDGVILRHGERQSDAAEHGWTLTLPHAGELTSTLEAVSPLHLALTTHTPDGRMRSYLIEAASGESVMQAGPARDSTRAVTGVPLDHRFGEPVSVVSAIATGSATQPGKLAHDTFEIGMWHIDGDTAYRAQQAQYRSRRGRLGWRELIRTAP